MMKEKRKAIIRVRTRKLTKWADLISATGNYPVLASLPSNFMRGGLHVFNTITSQIPVL